MKRKIKGFTLTEVIITMVLIITLSIVSMPLYRGRFSNQAKIAEGYALLGSIRDAQVSYYNEYGYFFSAFNSFAPGNNQPQSIYTYNDPVLKINAINNRYFSLFNYDDSFFSYGNWRYRICIRVFSSKVGSITQLFSTDTRSNPIVNGGSTDLSI